MLRHPAYPIRNIGRKTWEEMSMVLTNMGLCFSSFRVLRVIRERGMWQVYFQVIQ